MEIMRASSITIEDTLPRKDLRRQHLCQPAPSEVDCVVAAGKAHCAERAARAATAASVKDAGAGGAAAICSAAGRQSQGPGGVLCMHQVVVLGWEVGGHLKHPVQVVREAVVGAYVQEVDAGPKEHVWQQQIELGPAAWAGEWQVTRSKLASKT